MLLKICLADRVSISNGHVHRITDGFASPPPNRIAYHEQMLLLTIIDMYSFVVFGAVIISWIRLPQNNPISQFVNSLTEPVLAPIRRMLPDMGGLDFSPMILLIGLQIVKGVLAGAL